MLRRGSGRARRGIRRTREKIVSRYRETWIEGEVEVDTATLIP